MSLHPFVCLSVGPGSGSWKPGLESGRRIQRVSDSQGPESWCQRAESESPRQESRFYRPEPGFPIMESRSKKPGSGSQTRI